MIFQDPNLPQASSSNGNASDYIARGGMESLAFPNLKNDPYDKFREKPSTATDQFISLVARPKTAEASETLGLQGRIGPRLTTIAEGLAHYLERRVHNKLGKTVASLLDTFANPKLATLHLTDDLQEILTNASPQEIGETLNLLTAFLEQYHLAFKIITEGQARGIFLTPEAENEAWEAFMGEFSPSALHTAMEANHSVELSTFSNGLITSRAPLGGAIEGTLLKNKFAPKIIVKLSAWHNSNRQEMSQMEPDVRSPIFDTFKDSVESISEMLVEKFGLEIPSDELEPLQANHILVEKIGGKDVVFYCSPRARVFGIVPGMDPEVARVRWNAGKTPAEPIAQIITETTGFRGRKTLRETLNETILAVLMQPTENLYEMVCTHLIRVRYLGRPLALFFKAIAWLAHQMMGKVMRYIGFPTKEALAREITNNLLLHLNNPVLFAAPLAMMDGLFKILERRTTEGNGQALENHEAFLGLLTIQIGKLLETICPSLFRLRTSRIVRATTYVALWMIRKLGTRALVNSKTERYARNYLQNYFSNATRFPNGGVAEKMRVVERVFTWVRAGAVQVRNADGFVATTHNILTSGYRMLGELGIVSTDQSHFEQAGQSLPHLIHHTLIAAGRVFLTKKYYSGHHQFKMKMELLESKIENEEPITVEDLQPISTRIQAKLEQHQHEIAFVAAKRALVENIPIVTMQQYEQLLTNTSNLGVNAESGMNRWLVAKDFKVAWRNARESWQVLYTSIEETITAQRLTLGETDPELVSIKEQLSKRIELLVAMENEIGRLFDWGAIVTDLKSEVITSFEDLGSILTQQNKLQLQLSQFFTKQQTDLEEEIEPINTLRNAIDPNMDRPLLRQAIAYTLRESEILSFADRYRSEEQRLENALAALDQRIEQENTHFQTHVGTAINDPQVLHTLQVRKNDYYQAHQTRIDALPGRIPETANESGLWNKLKAMPSKMSKFASKTLFGDFEKEHLTPSLDREIDFHMSDMFAPFRQNLAELLAKRQALRRRLAELRSITNAKVLWLDPAWVLRQSGEQMVSLLKRVIPAGSVANWMSPRPTAPERANAPVDPQQPEEPVVQQPQVIEPRAIPDFSDYMMTLLFYRLAICFRNVIYTANQK